jgi:hypothetical protein
MDATAAWAFESFGRIFKPFLRTGYMPINQLNNRLLERYVHHVPTFMDAINPYRNRMRYVIGDITITEPAAPQASPESSDGEEEDSTPASQPSSQTSQASHICPTCNNECSANKSNTTLLPTDGQSRRKGQQHLAAKKINLKKTAASYSHHLKLLTLADYKKSSSRFPPSAPLRMYIGKKNHKSRHLTPKRLVYDQFELGNEFPNNCSLIIDTRHWLKTKEIRYWVIVVRQIFAAALKEDDKRTLRTLEVLKRPPTSSSIQGNDMDQEEAQNQINYPKVVFHILGSKFQVQEAFDTYPVDSALDHIYLVQKPRQGTQVFLADQVIAKMNVRHMSVGKPFDISADTSVGLQQQKWHVSPILHSLSFSHTHHEGSFYSSGN